MLLMAVDQKRRIVGLSLEINKRSDNGQIPLFSMSNIFLIFIGETIDI